MLISEGLLMYLPSETVHALAAEVRDAGFQLWLLDSSSPTFMRRAHGDAVEHINRVRAESHLEGSQIREAVEQHGWKPVDRRLFIEEGPKLALQRILKIIQSEGRPPETPVNDGSGVWLYHREH
jgi:O-methyltransferase involved in polyketide biosynthesis